MSLFDKLRGAFSKNVADTIDDQNDKRLNSSQKTEKTKTVVVFSPNPKDGKTTLIETLCGRQLEWSPYKVQGDYLCNLARVNYGNTSITIVEAGEITFEMTDLWPELANKLLVADLILYVIDSSQKLVLSDLDDFFDTEINGQLLNEIVKSKRLVIFTKSDLPKECDVWWNSLTKEEQDEYNRKNATQGNPRFNTWYEGLVNDWYMCSGMWLSMNVDNNNDIYEVSCESMKGIQELRERLIALLVSS